jgi:hypothetical protein
MIRILMGFTLGFILLRFTDTPVLQITGHPVSQSLYLPISQYANL